MKAFTYPNIYHKISIRVYALMIWIPEFAKMTLHITVINAAVVDGDQTQRSTNSPVCCMSALSCLSFTTNSYDSEQHMNGQCLWPPLLTWINFNLSMDK